MTTGYVGKADQTGIGVPELTLEQKRMFELAIADNAAQNRRREAMHMVVSLLNNGTIDRAGLDRFLEDVQTVEKFLADGTLPSRTGSQGGGA